MRTRLPLALALIATSSLGGYFAPANAAPPKQCKSMSQTIGPNQSWQGMKCKWKYGCDCVMTFCKHPYTNRWVPQGGGNCIQLPG